MSIRSVVMKPKHEHEDPRLAGVMTFVSLKSGQQKSIFVELPDNIYEVKAKWNSEVHPRSISFMGNTLEDAHTLAECGIELSDTLHFSTDTSPPFSS